MEMEKFDVVAVQPANVWWRIYEKEMMEKHLGTSVQYEPHRVVAEDIMQHHPKWVYWKLNTEVTDEATWMRCVKAASRLDPSIRQINDPRGWMSSHAKEECFQIWRDHGIPVPDWFEFQEGGFDNSRMSYPYLLRINNGNTGLHSYLCHNDRDRDYALGRLKHDMKVCYDGAKTVGARRRLICVKFIDALQENGQVNMSFRIIVAAKRVVAGYARIGPPSDWIAITSRFEPWMESIFVRCNQLCEKFCRERAEDLIRSVQVLRQTFLGIDVILDRQGTPYWLEVQPGFSVGYANRPGWHPPFYNPSKPQALVDFLQKNLEQLKQQIPFYCTYWLDKEKMFDTAFQAIKEQ